MTLLVSYDLISDRHILAPFPDKTLHRLPGCARSRGAHRTAFRGAEIPKRPGDSLASETRSGGGVASQSARVHPFSPRQARQTSARPPARRPQSPSAPAAGRATRRCCDLSPSAPSIARAAGPAAAAMGSEDVLVEIHPCELRFLCTCPPPLLASP